EPPVDPALRSALARIDYTGLAVDMLEEALLARSAVMARSTFDGQPRIAATLLQQVSSSYRDLGRLEQAGALQQEALALLRGSVGADDRLTLSSMREELKLLRVAGSADAEARHREVLAAHVRALGSDDSDTHL